MPTKFSQNVEQAQFDRHCITCCCHKSFAQQNGQQFLTEGRENNELKAILASYL